MATPLLLTPNEGITRVSSTLSPSPSDEKKDLAFVEANEIDPSQPHQYAPVESYEGRHRFDPDATWTDEEEKKLVRKIDLRIMSFACLIFFALQLDRGNLSSALADNFLGDTKMNTQDYNNGQSIFFCAFLFAELPSQLFNKWLGTSNWVPFQVIAWSTITIGQGWIHNRSGFFATRALLGLAEGGLIPDMVLYLTYFYKNSELPVRLTWFWIALALTGVFQGFLAYGVLRLRSLGHYPGWSYLFWIEGAVTFAIGLFAALYLPASPTQTTGRARGNKGWFSAREETIMVNRILREDPSKGTMSQAQHISWKDFKACLSDYDSFPLYFYALSALVPFGAPGGYLTLTLRGLGFSTFNVQLLVIPSTVAGVIVMLAVTYLSNWVNQRALVLLIAQFWGIISLAVLVALPTSAGSWARYSVLTVLLASPSPHALAVAWNATNAGSVRQRTISASLYNICTQVGTILGTQIYRPNDLPRYDRANKILIAVAAFNSLTLVSTKLYYLKRNRTKRAAWKALNSDEKEVYARDVAPFAGQKSLLFEFKH